MVAYVFYCYIAVQLKKHIQWVKKDWSYHLVSYTLSDFLLDHDIRN